MRKTCAYPWLVPRKTALLWHQGQWMLPHGSTQTTHILKLPIGMAGHRQADYITSVKNEWLCMNLLAEFGLPWPKQRF